MSDKLKQTIRIKRAKVKTDDRGQTVWAAPVEEMELELVSTVMLQKILKNDDETNRKGLEEASCGKDGVLARNVETDQFEIVDDYELQGTQELSLVSTQALRRILREDSDKPAREEGDTNTDEETSGDSGFDPYNNA